MKIVLQNKWALHLSKEKEDFLLTPEGPRGKKYGSILIKESDAYYLYDILNKFIYQKETLFTVLPRPEHNPEKEKKAKDLWFLLSEFDLMIFTNDHLDFFNDSSPENLHLLFMKKKNPLVHSLEIRLLELDAKNFNQVLQKMLF